jgi:hypothetical protein
MKEPFYYFFSATPQVLAATLALFGVYMVFKIETMRSELLGIADVIHNLGMSQLIPTVYDRATDFTLAIKRKDVRSLRRLISEIITENENAISHRKRYIDVYDFLQKLINLSKWSSVFTAVIIFLCLFVIPFGNFFIDHSFLLHKLYATVIIGIAISLSGLTYVLVMSFKDTYYNVGS